MLTTDHTFEAMADFLEECATGGEILNSDIKVFVRKAMDERPDDLVRCMVAVLRVARKRVFWSRKQIDRWDSLSQRIRVGAGHDRDAIRQWHEMLNESGKSEKPVLRGEL